MGVIHTLKEKLKYVWRLFFIFWKITLSTLKKGNKCSLTHLLLEILPKNAFLSQSSDFLVNVLL